MTEFGLQLVDSDDSTVLFDFQDPTGAANPYGVQTWFGLDGQFLLGPPEQEVIRFASSEIDGQRALRNRVRGRAASWPQRIVGADYDSLAAGVGELAQMLRRGGTLRWQPQGADDARWLDFEPSLAPAYLNGQPQDLRLAVLDFDTAHGVPLALTCAPYLRSVILRSETNLLQNALLLRDTLQAGDPDSWTWDSTTNITNMTIDPDEGAFVFDVATSSARNLQQTTDPNSVGVGATHVFSFYARQVSGSVGRVQAVIEYLDASNALIGSAHTNTLTALTSSWTRYSLSFTPSPTGTVRARVSIRIQNSSAASNTIAVRWAQFELDGLSGFVPGLQDMGVSSGAGTGAAFPIWVQGNAWSPVALKLRSDDNTAKVGEYVVGRRSDGGETRLKQAAVYLNGPLQTLSNQGLSNDTFPVTDTTAGRGQAAEVRYTSDAEVMKKRVRGTPAVDSSAMRGRWNVWVRVKTMEASVHRLQLRWAPSLVLNVPNSNDEVELDSTQATTHGYVMKDLGSITLPYDFDDLQDAALEVWTRRVSGTGFLRLDELRFVPVDDPDPCAARILAPARSEESWLGVDLETPPTQLIGDPTWLNGAVQTDGMRLNLTNEATGTPPNSGSQWSSGRQVVTINFAPGTSGGVFTLVCRVVNVTDSITVSQQTLTFTASTVPEPVILQFDSVTGKSYQTQVLMTSRSAGHIDVTSIEHTTTPYLGQQTAAYTDPETNMVARLNSSDIFTMRLAIEGEVPLWCPPGLSVVYVHAVDVPLVGYTDGESVVQRTWSAGIKYAPRYWA